MKVTISEFRKNLFQLVDRAIEGEYVEVTRNEHTVRLVPENQPSKMSRLVKRNTIPGTAEDLELARKELKEEIRNHWDAKWDTKL